MGPTLQHAAAQENWTEAEAKAPTPRPSVRGRPLGKKGRDIVAQAVTQAVIPRLVALPCVPEDVPAGMRPGVGEASVRRLTSLCLATDPQGVAVFIADLHRSGIAPAVLFEDLMAPVARALGVMWDEDECSFADVTIGVLRLQNAQRTLSEASGVAGTMGPGAPRALLLPIPGEQHSFGLSIVADSFVRAGWDAKVNPVATASAAIGLVRTRWLDLIGLSLASDEKVEQTRAMVTALRDNSVNPDLIVMVGGPAFIADPTLCERIGADATAADGHQAVLRANELLHPAARSA